MKLDANSVNVTLSRKEIVHQASIHVKSGEFVGLIGPNGSGKTTLLKSIYRVLKPSGGEIFLDGQELRQMSYRDTAKRMGVVSQFTNLSFDFSVEEMVLMGRTPHKKTFSQDTLEDFQIVEDALRRVDILKRNGFSPVAFKCGPDYLDTMFHTAVIGVESANLDPFFLDGNGLRGVLCSHMGSHSLAVVEGVMGYYDGTGENGMENSTFSVAEGTGSPVILVVSGKGAFTSILAQIEGFLHFVPESRIKGVIINQISKGSYTKIASLIARRFGEDIKPIGFLPVLPKECILESRHLGLVAAQEINGLREKLDRLAGIAEDSIDVDSLIQIAGRAEMLSAEIWEIPFLGKGKIAVAMIW